jgi:hypothetical protein
VLVQRLLLPRRRGSVPLLFFGGEAFYVFDASVCLICIIFSNQAFALLLIANLVILLQTLLLCRPLLDQCRSIGSFLRYEFALLRLQCSRCSLKTHLAVFYWAAPRTSSTSAS